MEKASIQVLCDEGDANRISDSVPFLAPVAGIYKYDYDLSAQSSHLTDLTSISERSAI